MNIKVDALIRMFLVNIFESAQRLEDHFQTILISDRVDVLLVESKANLYQQVHMKIKQMSSAANINKL